ATINPANGATDVAITINPTISFDEPIYKNDGTILTDLNMADIITFEGISSVSYTATINGAMDLITIIPDVSLDNDIEYTITLNNVEDSVGNVTPLTTSAFRTIAVGAPDVLAPVATFAPTTGSTGVSTTIIPIITFNEPVKKIDNTQLINSDLASLITFNVAFTATINAAKTVITVTPTSELTGETNFTLSVGAVKDVSGNTSAIQSTSFTTEDNTAPLLSFSPTNGATNVAQNSLLTITSNEALVKTDGNPIENSDLDNLIALKNGAIDIPFSATINAGKTVITITPSQNLSPETSYILTINPVADTFGNATVIKNSSFTTNDDLSIVCSPTNGSFNVPEDAKIKIAFNRGVVNIGGAEITNGLIPSLLTLKDENDQSIAFTAIINATKDTITATPNSTLANSILHKVTFQSVEDTYGNTTDIETVFFTAEDNLNIINFNTAAYWINGGPGLEYWGNHSYIDTEQNVEVIGHQIKQVNGNEVSFQFDYGTYLRIKIASGGVGNFRFKIRNPLANATIAEFKVRYSLNNGSSWTDFPQRITMSHIGTATPYIYKNSIANGNDDILIEIVRLDSNGEIYFDDFKWSSAQDFTTPYAITINEPVGSNTTTITTSPATSATFKKYVAVNIANAYSGTIFNSMNVTAEDLSSVPLQTITAGEEYMFLMPRQAVTINTNFKNTITIADVVGGTANVTSNLAIAAVGETININIASIQAGQSFVSIAIVGANSDVIATTQVTEGVQYSFSMPAQPVTVTVTLIEYYTLTYTAGANGSLTGITSQTVNHGANGTAVEAVPNANYHFTKWSDDVIDNPRTDMAVTENINVTAQFAIDTYSLTYAAGANGSLTGITSQTVN
ncbi:MAG: Ig-like domain-containing protein, partial [Salinivirgaceae bacterium]|nr:Ig-like domain-containing protein [Salinivirgaceae bacterium]